MLENKIREVFADMVVLKDPQRSEYFSNLSMPSYMRDWLVMKFSDEDGNVDYDSVRRYIKRYIPGKDDFEQYKFQLVNGDTVQFLARVRVSVDIKSGKTKFELPDFGGSKGGAAGVVAYEVVEQWQIKCGQTRPNGDQAPMYIVHEATLGRYNTKEDVEAIVSALINILSSKCR